MHVRMNVQLYRYFLLAIVVASSAPTGALRLPIGRIPSLNRQKLVESEPDSAFYRSPRLVKHADEEWISELTALYRRRIRPGARVLDLMSSHVSIISTQIVGLQLTFHRIHLAFIVLKFFERVLQLLTIQLTPGAHAGGHCFLAHQQNFLFGFGIV